MTKEKQIEQEDVTKWTDAQLRSVRNLADFELRCAVVIGERVFQMLLPKVQAEMNRRCIA